MVIAAEVYNVSHIVMVWEINEQCVGHFLEIFQPLDNVTFIPASQIRLFEKQAVAYPSFMYSKFLQILHLHRSRFTSWHQLRREGYELFVPVSFIQYEVLRFVKVHNICHCIGVHVRHTDLDDHPHVYNTNHESNEPYFQFIDAHNTNSTNTKNVSSASNSNTSNNQTCVYLMTDNPSTQQIFLKRYGESSSEPGSPRVWVYEIISAEPPSASASASTLSHRYTHLQHTIVDVLITAFTYEFLGSPGSSMSELVSLMDATFVRSSAIYAASTACRYRNNTASSSNSNSTRKSQ